MNILQVSYLDIIGGAARIAQDLHNSYRILGHKAWMMVGHKSGKDPFVLPFPQSSPDHLFGKVLYRVSLDASRRNIKLGPKNVGGFIKRISEPRHIWNDYWGIEDFEYPGTQKLLSLCPDPPDIFHAHILHKKYFDLRYLPELSLQLPTVVTLHDMWLFTGHCAYSLNCARWKTGCGSCPYLNTYPPVNKDATSYNWERKRQIYSNSLLYFVSPSKWLLNKLKDSILSPAEAQSRVIQNGVDLNFFHPANKKKIRRDLELPDDAFILLFVAVGAKENIYKDYDTIRLAVERLPFLYGKKKIIFIAMGGNDSKSSFSGNLEIKYLRYIRDPKVIASYYQAADLFLHAAHAENFPNVVLEALACGTPVIATNIGGVSEQIIDGKTGFLVPVSDSAAMSNRIEELFYDLELRIKIASSAGEDAASRFSLDRMASDYLSFYNEAALNWKESRTKNKSN